MSQLTKYPFDPTGKSITNRMVDEEHEVGGVYSRIIVPHHAPFYGQGFVLTTEHGRPLVPNEEYKLLYLNKGATEATGIAVYSAVVILNETILGNVRQSYQIVGGEYSSVGPAIVEAVENLNSISLDVHWEDIMHKPEEFTPVDHKHHSRDLTGMLETVNSIKGVESAIREKIQYGIDTRVSLLGHTKLIVDEGHINIEDTKVGPLVLTFGRSSEERGRVVLELEMINDLGTSRLLITGWEVEGGFDPIRYDVLGPSAWVPTVAMYAKDGYNHVVVGEGDSIWDRTFFSVKSVTVSSLEVTAYQFNWVWRYAEQDEVFPEQVQPTNTEDQVAGDLSSMQTAILGLSALLNSHIQDKTNPHEVNAEDVSLDLVENFAASTDYRDASETLYATAKSVHDLDHATSEEIAEASQELVDAIEDALDRGRTF